MVATWDPLPGPAVTSLVNWVIPPEPVAINVVPLKANPAPKVIPTAFANDPVGFPTRLLAATCWNLE